jgi:hypothetical protein
MKVSVIGFYSAKMFVRLASYLMKLSYCVVHHKSDAVRKNGQCEPLKMLEMALRHIKTEKKRPRRKTPEVRKNQVK